VSRARKKTPSIVIDLDQPLDIDNLIELGFARETPNPNDPDDPFIELSPQFMKLLDHEGDEH